MKLGILAAGAIEEIEAGLAPANSTNLKMLVDLTGGEPIYDPIQHYYNGHKGMRDAALGYCEDLALVDGIVFTHH